MIMNHFQPAQCFNFFFLFQVGPPKRCQVVGGLRVKVVGLPCHGIVSDPLLLDVTNGYFFSSSLSLRNLLAVRRVSLSQPRRLHHPNIVELLEVHEEKSKVYLVMELWVRKRISVGLLYLLLSSTHKCKTRDLLLWPELLFSFVLFSLFSGDFFSYFVA